MNEAENTPPISNRKTGGRPSRLRIERKAMLIPSLITVAAFFSGFLAIISGFNGNYEYATKCIAVAFIFDGLDGRVARRLNATSAFGREFDSLSDVVAFGAAPALLVYSWAFTPFADEIGVLFAFLFVVCGGARLARFNIAPSEPTGEAKKHFTGLPIPAAAAAICALIYAHPEAVETRILGLLVMAYTVALAGLMVSTIPFFSFKHIRLTDRNLKWGLLALAVLVALTWYQSRIVFLVVTMIYVVSGPLSLFVSKKTQPPETQTV